MTYSEASQAWHDWYLTAGAGAATLVGLLFVGLSLHIRVVVSHPEVKSLARVTLSNFFGVMMVSLVVLAPVDAVRAGALLVLVATLTMALMVRPAIAAFRAEHATTISLTVLMLRFGLSAACYLGVTVIGVLFILRDFQDGLGELFGVVILVLVVAVRNTWDLLVTVAEKADLSHEGASAPPPSSGT